MLVDLERFRRTTLQMAVGVVVNHRRVPFVGDIDGDIDDRVELAGDGLADEDDPRRLGALEIAVGPVLPVRSV